MSKIYFFIPLLFISFINLHAQGYTIKGSLKDQQTGNPVQSATIALQSQGDTTAGRSAVSDSAGGFRFLNVLQGKYDVFVTIVGYAPVTKNISIDSSDINLDIQAGRQAGVLEGVTVTATVSPVTQKGDTVQYNASQYKVNPDATVEDLTRKMPGITLEDGQVKVNGDVVQKVTLDGREFFGEDATAALKNLPAEIVDKIQVFDRLSDQAQFTGIDDGNSTKGINIITKASMRNGQFGRLFAGYGTDSRYAAGGNTTLLKDNQKISFVGNFNNINQQNFATQDLLGVTSTTQRGGGGGGQGGGQRGGGQRGGGGGGTNGNFSGSNNFLVGQQNGINKTNSVGINYSNVWAKKVTLTGSYFFNNTNNTTDELLNRKYFSDAIPDLTQANIAASKNNNHRVNVRFEYKFDSANQLIITPTVSIQNNNSVKDANTAFFNDLLAPISRTHNINNSDRTATNLNNNILFRHSFPKKGRTLSVNLATAYNKRQGNVFTTQFDTTFAGGTFTDSAAQRFTDQFSNGYQISTNINYTEPVSANAQLQFSYNPGYTKSKADQEAYQYDDVASKYSIFNPALSSKFDNTTIAQRGGAAYRYSTKDNQFSIGADYQQSTLKSDQDFPRSLMVNKTFNNVLPNAMLRLKVSDKSNIRLMYRANTSQPSVTQLQDVYDITNLPFVTAGNPQLEQQYTHTLSGRYTFTDTRKGLLCVGNVFFQSANNYITNATYVPVGDSVLTGDVKLQSGQQLTKPVNLDGYTSLRSFFTFAIPLKFIKSNFNFNTGITFNKLPGIINSQLNKSRNTTYTLGTVIASNISQYIDFTVSYSANFNNVKNNTSTSLDQKYFSHVAAVQLNLLSAAGWFYQTDVNNQLYSGLAAGYNQSYFLWNMSAGKKFLANQRAELKLSVFDLLKQNRSIIRNVTETYIEDQQNEVLQRYFMLTFSYTLRNFGQAAAGIRRKRGF